MTDHHLPRIAVVGGGFTGLAAAFYLLRAGFPVDVLEARDALGGLSAGFDYGPFRWDRFYHCILTSDTALLGLLEDLDLQDRLRWTATEVGFFSGGRLHRMTRPVDLLQYPELSPWGKLRFGLGTLYAARAGSRPELEDVPLRDWVRRVFGAEAAARMWEPLLRAKLGPVREKASAAFLAATIQRLYSTRDKGAEKGERLGYVEGGYTAVLQALVGAIQKLGGRIRCGVSLREVGSLDGTVFVREPNGLHYYGSAILTVGNRAAASLLRGLPPAYAARLHQAEYLALLCGVLLLKRPLSPYYLTNITDPLAMTGVVEMTNLIGTAHTSGRSLVYLPRYTTPSDPLFAASDAEVSRAFDADLHRMHPDLKPGDVEGRWVFRERAVQPVPTVGYSTLALPAMETPLPGVLLANSSQIVNNTLNNNAMTGIAKAAARAAIARLEAGAHRPRTGFSSPEIPYDSLSLA